MSRCREPQTQEQAFAEALYLELVAPGDGEAQAAAMLAGEFAAGLDAATVDPAKAHALETFEAEADGREAGGLN